MEKKSSIQKIQEYLKYLLVLLVVVFISFLFPDNAKFKYSFHKGHNWQYDDLKAPFDFAIKKKEDELKAAVDAVQNNFSPYYKIDPEVAKTSKAEFTAAFENQLTLAKREFQFQDVIRKTAKYRKFGLRLIDNIYRRGIIQLDSAHMTKGGKFVINIINGNAGTPNTIENIPTLEKLEASIVDSLYNQLKEAEFLIPVFEGVFKPNLFYNARISNQFLQTELDGIATSSGMVRKGELIIPRNGIVTDDLYQILISYKETYEINVFDHKYWLGIFCGYFILTSLIFALFLMYLRINEKKIFNKFSNLLFILLWPVIFSWLVYLIEPMEKLDAYMIPFCIAPIVIKHFFNARLALFSHIVIILIASFLSSLDYEFTFIHMLAGIAVILLSIDLRYWNQFFRAMASVLLCYFIAYFALSLTRNGNIDSIELSTFSMLFLNVVLCMLAYPLIPLVEKLFRFTSSVSLVELLDMNHPLLKELSIKAPGTLQHSLQVANLSEAAANSIRANSLLVKVGALYHDIGKIKNAKYFVENQTQDNPHDKLSPEDSVAIILGHVTEGVRLAKKHRLPDIIIKFIKSHHGTTKVAYFYHQYCNQNPEIVADEQPFCYTGPRPRSKEETILMIADSLEAACKSLKNPTGQDIDLLVDKIIQSKISRKQLEHADLSFKELEICKREFKKLLRSINHVRIEYPTGEGK